ncbi:MAG: hypothetical protein PHZ11_02415 [Desulfitobacteriaceae bacterium]|nr:hypothetical protein [Desulfitobacteriaceae bacterium]MDD4345749.1 hypothetical protein [Desulfitobacteriaceae bacterium]MDD4400954.1 hypothetical protein [Desulfitobacteriaceae bacterium]
MPNFWGRPPRNRMGQDRQALVIWIFVIGVVAYLLFPTFFKDVFSRMSDPVADTSSLAEVTLPPTTGSELENTQAYPTVSNSLYNDQDEVATGYWVIFVAEGEFKQLSLTNESYNFLLGLIEDDRKAAGQNSVILTFNGQIHKYLVSDEVYKIIISMETISCRKHGS